jgi:hypothetical protein
MSKKKANFTKEEEKNNDELYGENFFENFKCTI